MSLHNTFIFLILSFRLASVQKLYYGQLSDSYSLWSTVDYCKVWNCPDSWTVYMYIGMYI